MIYLSVVVPIGQSFMLWYQGYLLFEIVLQFYDARICYCSY